LSEPIGEPEHRRPDRRHAEQRGDHPPRAEAVEQDAERKLEQAERQEIGAREQPDLGGLERELAREVLRDDRVDVAEEVGEEVASRERQEDEPDQPGGEGRSQLAGRR
jgi:hypothetical protein